MPELPEVQTTVNGLNKHIRDLKILDVWSDYDSVHFYGKENIKDPKYFKKFRENLVGEKILNAERKAKNVLIDLSGNITILIHMKMTGHLLYGKYKFQNKKWIPTEEGALKDPYNRFIRLIFSLSNGKHLALCDSRRFAKVVFFNTSKSEEHKDLKNLGPDALSKDMSPAKFKKQLFLKPNWKIKQALLNQEIISGIGNIYSDELLWLSGVHPASVVAKIPKKFFPKIFWATKIVLTKGLDFGGDSMSDYRNILGEPGKFHHTHNVYRLTKEKCKKNGCDGKIEKIKIGGRRAHFCPKHQKLYK